MKPNINKLHPVMLAGTGSDVGKSILATALCRIFLQEGYSPAPFKAQNMALNSAVTPDGKEIGRAQMVQAEAACVTACSDMNPLLLKPSSNHTSQVVLNGIPIGNRNAYSYFRNGETKEGIDFRKEVCDAFDRLADKYNPIVMEGAGSISEINLRKHDLVNMPMAKHADAKVILVADIDRGGVFAACYGSIMLQDPEDKLRIVGIIVNKFRGDIRLFHEGKKMLENICGVPVLGVIPYMQDIHIEEEDSVALAVKSHSLKKNRINIGVIELPRISNYTDLDKLSHDTRVNVFYTKRVDELCEADIIVIPGTKNTLEDLKFLYDTKLATTVIEAHRQGKRIVGICGGYQMMGLTVNDPEGVEGQIRQMPGLGLLNVDTTITSHKVTKQVELNFKGHACKGYEIHMGTSCLHETGCDAPILVWNGENTLGTYVHGILDNDAVTEWLLAPFIDKTNETNTIHDYSAYKNMQYDKLADHVRKHLDLNKLFEILKIKKKK